MFEYLTTAFWKDKVLTIRNRQLLIAEAEKSGLKEFEIVIKSKVKSRSNQQSRYYWLCVSIVAGELGYSKDELHAIIGYKFLRKEKVNEKTGEVYEYIESTTKLSTTEFMNFMDEFVRWSAESLDIVLPLPDEQFTLL